MFVANGFDVVAHRAKLVVKKAVLRQELMAMYEKNQELFPGVAQTNDTQDRNRCVCGAFASAIAKIQEA